jgi:D-alanyl-D-alanine carboxypeptidase
MQFFNNIKNMKKILSFVIAILFCTGARAADYHAALVADMDTGRVIFSEHANDANYPASLTKIMTLYLTFDALEHGRLHLDDYLIVSQSAAAAPSVKLGLAAGSKIRVEDAIIALAVYSANDVARVLAENLKGGKEGTFASLMTRVAREIGLSHTNFENSSGLPDDDHLSTARDIALLSMAVYRHFPQYWKYFGIKTWTYNGKTYTNGNRLLETYPGCDGMKTGYTNKSKYSLVATAARGGHHLLSVVLGAESKDVRTAVSMRLLNRGFESYGIGVPANYTVEPAPVTSPIVQKYADDAPQIAPTAAPTYATGGVGVQFGAFGSTDSANAMIARVKNATGATAHLESNGAGLYRVRVTGLTESAAQNLKNRASAAGIDCYVFH